MLGKGKINVNIHMRMQLKNCYIITENHKNTLQLVTNMFKLLIQVLY